VDQQDEKKKVETIKSETAMECNWIMCELLCCLLPSCCLIEDLENFIIVCNSDCFYLYL
jgi:hypothetical protein